MGLEIQGKELNSYLSIRVEGQYSLANLPGFSSE